MPLISFRISSVWVCYSHIYRATTEIWQFFNIWISLSCNLFYFNTNCQKNKILWNPIAVSYWQDNRCCRPVALIFEECLTARWEFHLICDCFSWVAQASCRRCEQADSSCFYKVKSLFWMLGIIFESNRIGITVRSWDQAVVCTSDNMRLTHAKSSLFGTSSSKE